MAIGNRLKGTGGKRKRDASGKFATIDKSVAQRRFIRNLKNRLEGRRMGKGDQYNDKGQLKKRTTGSRASKGRIPTRKKKGK